METKRKNPDKDMVAKYGPKIKELFEQGHRASYIGKHIGVSTDRVNYIIYKALKLVRYQKPIRNKKLENQSINPQLSEKIIFYYSWGYTPCEIKEELQVPVEIIHTLIRNHEIIRKAPSLNS